MELRDILVVLRSGHDESAVLGAAAMLAHGNRAFLRGLCVESAVVPSVAESFAIGARAVNAVAKRLEDDRDAMLAAARGAFDRARAACGADGEWMTLAEYDATGQAPEQGRLADLVVMARPDPRAPDFRHLVEAMLMRSGAPCLLVPGGFAPADAFHQALVAWDGSKEARRAIDEAMPLLRSADRVEVIIVDNGRDAIAQDAPLEAYLARHDLAAHVLHALPSPDVAGAILRRIASSRTDLVVMGAYGHTPRSEAFLGGVSLTILQHTPIPVLLAR